MCGFGPIEACVLTSDLVPDPFVEDQAVDRTHRIGQKNGVTVHLTADRRHCSKWNSGAASKAQIDLSGFE